MIRCESAVEMIMRTLTLMLIGKIVNVTAQDDQIKHHVSPLKPVFAIFRSLLWLTLDLALYRLLLIN